MAKSEEGLPNNEIVNNFKRTLKKGFWRERYEVVRSGFLRDNLLNNDESCRTLLINIAHFDPCHIVRNEAVRTCNVLNVRYKNEKVMLRKMRTLNNTIIAEKINIRTIILMVFLKAEIQFYPQKKKLNFSEAFTKKEWIKFYEQFKTDYPKVFDLLDGHFTVANRKRKCNVTAINSKDTFAMRKYIYNLYRAIPEAEFLKFCKKHSICIPLNEKKVDIEM